MNVTRDYSWILCGMATNALINLMPTVFVGHRKGNISYSVQVFKSYSSRSIGCSKYALTERMMRFYSMRTHNECVRRRAFKYIRTWNVAHNVHPESAPIAHFVCHCPKNKIYNRYQERSCSCISRSQVQNKEYGEVSSITVVLNITFIQDSRNNC